MAQFPTSAKTFTPRSNGQTIDAAHVGDLQDEVAAIEDGYLNGSARLNSSNSTLANLSVAGGSTLTGALSVGGNSTLTGNLSVGGASTFAGAVTFNGAATFNGAVSFSVPRIRVTLGVDMAIPDNTFTGINWDAEAFDSHAMHSTVTNSSRITFVDSTGIYHIGYTVTWSANSSGGVAARVVLNDSTANFVTAQSFQSTAVLAVQSGAAIMRVASTADYATVQVFQNSGSTRSISSTSIYGNNFWAYKVSS